MKGLWQNKSGFKVALKGAWRGPGCPGGCVSGVLTWGLAWPGGGTLRCGGEDRPGSGGAVSGLGPALYSTTVGCPLSTVGRPLLFEPPFHLLFEPPFFIYCVGQKILLGFSVRCFWPTQYKWSWRRLLSLFVWDWRIKDESSQPWVDTFS